MCRDVLHRSTLILNKISKDALLLSYITPFPFCFQKERSGINANNLHYSMAKTQ